MNLLRIITSMDPASGGPCQGIRNSIPELEKIGVHNEVVSLDDPSMDFLGKDSFPIHAIGPEIGVWGYNKNLIPWLEANLGRFDAAIVHGLWKYHSYAASKTIRRLRDLQANSRIESAVPKLYLMPHGMLDPYFQRAQDRRLKAMRNWLYWKLIEHRVVNNADGILFTCEAELLLAREPFSPYSPKREINVGYGIQAPPPYNQSMREAFLKKCPQVAESSYVLFLSRIHEKKGIDLLIDAYDKIQKGLTNNKQKSGTKLVVAGPGLDSQYGERIRKLVENSVIRDSVCFPGMLSGDAKWGAFYGCDAFVLPSHQENFGIAVAEALACGRPVLISNQVNIWKEIKEAGGGLVADDTAEGTQDLLLRWENLSPAERSAMGQNAKRAYEAHFAVGPAAKQLAEAVRS